MPSDLLTPATIARQLTGQLRPVGRDGRRSFAQRRLGDAGPGTCLTNDSLDGHNKKMSYPFLSKAADGTLVPGYPLHRRAIKHLRLSPDWLEEQR